MSDTIQLQVSCVSNIPLQNYIKDFTFIVNDEKFETNIFIAHMLSPIISKMYLIDPTINEFTITTKEHGNFQKILDLVNFNINEISENEKNFLSDIFDQLGTENIKITEKDPEITINNVFQKLFLYQQCKFFNEIYQKEIDFISEHFFELNNEQTEEFLKLSIETLNDIFSNSNLLLQNEDQLLDIVTYLYSQDKKYSLLFDYIDFLYVEVSSISKFLSIFDYDDLSNEIWSSLSSRLKQRIIIDKEENQTKRHKTKSKINLNAKAKQIFEYKSDQFDGIFKYLLNKSNENIENEISLSASSVLGESCKLKNVFDFSNRNYFMSKDEVNPWICFNFKNHQIILTNYTIRSYYGTNDHHPKSWIIEGSNDNSIWEKLDEQKDLNVSHLFTITNSSSESYIVIFECV